MICMHSALCHALSFFLLSVCLSVCLLFRTSSITYGNSQARGRIRGAVASLHHSHSNAGSELHLRLTPTVHSTVRSLTHWVRPGMEPASSWILVRFVVLCFGFVCGFFFFFAFLGLHLWHMEAPTLWVESELQLEPTPQPQQCRIHPCLQPIPQFTATSDP